MTIARGWLVGLLVMALSSTAPAWAQAPTPGADKTEEKKEPTLWDEVKLFSYIENSYTFNLTGAGRDATNELRFYDYDEGWTFNMAEFSIKKDPSEKYWFGFGLVVTAGLDAQKTHSIGIFRDEDDAFPFRNTFPFDLQEAYLSVRVPVGNGLILKGGKFVTLLGYEVIESPNNLNFSRSNLFVLAVPLTHTGGLMTYQFADWFSMTVGGVLGWDNSKETNGAPSATGQFAFTPVKDLVANFNWIVGPEQIDNNENLRYVLDWVFTYTGGQRPDPGPQRRLRTGAERGPHHRAGEPAEHRRQLVGVGGLRGLRLDRAGSGPPSGRSTSRTRTERARDSATSCPSGRRR